MIVAQCVKTSCVPEVGDMITCDLCGQTIGSVGEAISDDWSPSYFIPNEMYEISEPICDRCTVSRCHVTDAGELELITDDTKVVNATLANTKGHR